MSSTPAPVRNIANIAGFFAILSWALLALLADGSKGVPPFQTSAISFGIGALIGGAYLTLTKKSRDAKKSRKTKPPLGAIAISALGLFAYHALYFTAVKSVPVAEASLIAYLWPLLIVIGSAMLPGETLRWWHIAGALAGFGGCALIITGRADMSTFAIQPGHFIALTAAFVWAAYSLVSRYFAKVPTSYVALYCAITSIGAALCAYLFEDIVWPLNASQWLSLIGLGILPLGIAFYTWDYGMKRGNVQLIGTASYAAPLLSTLILIIAGTTDLTMPIGIACVLITLGAVLASGKLGRARKD